MKKAFLALVFLGATAQTCTYDPGPGPGPGPGPIARSPYACFNNRDPDRRIWFRVEWRDGSGRTRIFPVAPGDTRRIRVGRGRSVQCWAYRRRAVARRGCVRPRRVVHDC